MLEDIPVLIPAFNPGDNLPGMVAGLKSRGFQQIIVVDDGSANACAPVFEGCRSQGCTLLRHAVNLGKGRALKTGLNYFYLHFPGSPGIVTADCDGQHEVEDIIKVAESLVAHPGSLVMGAREFGNDIPLRSLFGNLLTRFVFRFLIGYRITDTQSGLRGIPHSLVPRLLRVNGEKYEYEINMLILAGAQSFPVLEVPIRTVYLDNNRSSHFNPFFDSMKIYFQLLRYAFSSLLASFFDFIIFAIMFGISHHLLISLLAARSIVGPLLNYIINKRFVFRSKNGITSFLKYYLALIFMSFLSWYLIHMVVSHSKIHVVSAKIIVESMLFLFNYFIQREFVFINREERRIRR